MAGIVPPIVVVEGFDVVVHPSLKEAEQWLEPWWVQKNEGVVYDATGNRLGAAVDKKAGTIKLVRSAADASSEKELKLALIEYLLRSGKSSEESQLQSFPLQRLIQMASTRRT